MTIALRTGLIADLLADLIADLLADLDAGRIGLVRLRDRPAGPAARAWAGHLVRTARPVPSGGLAPGPAGIQ